MRKKRRTVCAVIAAILLIVMLIPIPLRIKDGGSVCYSAILYQVTRYHSLTSEEGVFLGGCQIRVLGLTVYEKTYKIYT